MSSWEGEDEGAELVTRVLSLAIDGVDMMFLLRETERVGLRIDMSVEGAAEGRITRKRMER